LPMVPAPTMPTVWMFMWKFLAIGRGVVMKMRG